MLYLLKEDVEALCRKAKLLKMPPDQLLELLIRRGLADLELRAQPAGQAKAEAEEVEVHHES